MAEKSGMGDLPSLRARSRACAAPGEFQTGIHAFDVPQWRRARRGRWDGLAIDTWAGALWVEQLSFRLVSGEVDVAG